jgi:hypothetical protein
MNRRVFDALMSAGGGLLVVVLVVAGSLLMWGASFANSNVYNQLSQQKIYFPPKGSPQLNNPEIAPYLNPYAGQQLVTGQQAEVYADHFIAVHLKEIGKGQTYAQVSAEALANPKNQALKQEAQTLFQGETLRGLLLEAYAFSVFGEIAFWASVAAYILAGVMLILVVLGIWHLRKIPKEASLEI